MASGKAVSAKAVLTRGEVPASLVRLTLPLAMAGSYVAGMTGIFAGLMISYMVSGIIIDIYVRKKVSGLPCC